MPKGQRKIVSLTGEKMVKLPGITMGRPMSRDGMRENQLKFQKGFIDLASEGYRMYNEDMEGIEWWLKHHSSARNNIARTCLTRPDSDYLVWIDDDMTFKNLAEDVKQAIALDKDIVMGVTSCKPVPHFPNIGKFSEIGESGTIIDSKSLHVFDFPTDKPFEADFGSFGFVVMKRKVLEAMPAPWFCFPPNYQTGNVWGEDVYFCFNAKMLGFELWIDPTIHCGHLGYTAWHYESQASHWLDFKDKLMAQAKKAGWDCSHNLVPEVQERFKKAEGVKGMFV